MRGVDIRIMRSLPVRFVGALIALVIVGVVLYLGSVVSMYMIAWAVWVAQALFG